MMRWLVLLLACAASLSSVARAEVRHLELTFLPAGEGPALWLEASSWNEGDRLVRRVSFAWFLGEEVISQTRDDVVEGAPLLGHYPQPPADVPLEITAEGSLLITLPGLGDWQSLLPPADPRRALPRAEVPPVAFRESARLLVAAPVPGASRRGVQVAASLHGSERSVEGRVHLVVGHSAPDAYTGLVVAAGNELIPVPLTPAAAAGPRAFVADARLVCDRPVPRVILVPGGAGPLRLVGDTAVACVDGDVAVAPLAGAQLAPQGDVAVRGVIVSRPRG